MNNSQIYFTTI